MFFLRKQLFPTARGEFVHLGRRVIFHALQYVDKVFVGIDVMEPAGHQQTLHDTDVLGIPLGPAKHPVFDPWESHAACVQDD